jgi:uncharacterized protein with HEPN domain
MPSSRKWALRIEHILDAIAKIDQYTANLTETSFAGESMAVDAVLRNFQVIGEAARHVPNDVKSRYPKIPWSQMMGMRHVVVHGYNIVRLDIVWRTIQQDLPPLVEPLRDLLEQASREEGDAEGS